MQVDEQSAFQWIVGSLSAVFLWLSGKLWVRHERLKDEVYRKYPPRAEMKEAFDEVKDLIRGNHKEVMTKLDTKVDK